MQCLQIPIDHRLRAIIRRIRHVNLNYERSDHVDLLREFGTSLIYGQEEPHPAAALEFAYDLAGPATTGGIVVALDQPSASQKFSAGTVAEVDSCTTLRAVKELIAVTSNSYYAIDDISIFDAIPVISAPYDSDNEVFLSGDETFFQMIAAKRPLVLLSCFKSKSAHRQMRDLQSSGVGRLSPQTHIRVEKCIVKKVNAFHPSYAMNYHPEYACFRQLLVMEFAQAFSVLCGDWSEGKWMSELRTECRCLARQLINGKSKRLHPFPAVLGLNKSQATGATNTRFTLSSWETRWDPISKILRDTNFFRLLSFQPEQQIYKTIVDTKLTWKLCDAGLFLLKADLSDSAEMWEALQDVVTLCATMLWPSNELRFQTGSNAPGLYIPASVPTACTRLQSPSAHFFHNGLIRFVRDMNLTFKLSSQPNLKAQGDAFLRFAQSVENGLERMNGSATLDARLDLLRI